MDYDALIAANNREALAQLAVCDDHGHMRYTQSGVSLALYALYHGHTALAHELTSRCTHYDAFTAAAINDTATLQAALTQQPALIHEYAIDGFQLLGLACFFGAVDTAQHCINAGAHVNLPSANDFAVTPLHSATAADAPAIVAMLLPAGADPNSRQSGGFTPLHGAAQHGNVEIIRMLLAAGADPRLTNDAGKRAMAFVTPQHHPDCATLLRTDS